MLQQLVAHFSAVNAKTEMAIEPTETVRERKIAFPSLTTLRNYVLHIPRKIGCDNELKIAARSGEYLSKFMRKTSAKELNKEREQVHNAIPCTEKIIPLVAAIVN